MAADRQVSSAMADPARPTDRATSLRVARWAPAVLWLTFPFTVGPAIGEALAHRSSSVVVVAEVGAWSLWLVGLLAALVPSTISLTTMRIVFPASLVVAVWCAAVATDRAGVAASVALGSTAFAAVVSLWSTVGFVWVNGSSYGDERRFPLRAPAPVLFGALELVWAAMVASTLAGPMLLAARHWVWGGIVTALAIVLDAAGARILHQLSKRWLVLVPAGLVLVDRTVLLDAMLTLRQRVASIGYASEGSVAFDLSGGAIGAQLELRLTETGDIIPTPDRRDRHRLIDPIDVDAVRFTPSRPDHVLDEARARRLTVV